MGAGLYVTTGTEEQTQIEGTTETNDVLFNRGARLWRLFCDLLNKRKEKEELQTFADLQSKFFNSLQACDLASAISYADLAIAEAMKLMTLRLEQNRYAVYAVRAASWLESMAVEIFPGAYKWPVAQELPLYFKADQGYQAIDLGDGAAGIGSFFLDLYRNSGDSDHLKYAEGTAKYIIQHRLLDPEIDWLSGAAGVGCFYLDLWKATRNVIYLDEAQRAGDWLFNRHHEENGGYYWKHYSDIPRIYLGWACWRAFC